MTSFLWAWAIIMAFTSWFEGGLHSTLLLSYPILFIFAALFARQLAFISICCFLSVVIVFLGTNQIYGWFSPPSGMNIEGWPRLISVLVLSTLAGYICWIFGGLLRNSFDELKLENERVLESQNTIRRLADRDGLTGTLNRSGSESAYQALLKEVDFRKESFVIYFIDLDNFKSINDLFDHHAGDQLLITISKRLAELVPDKGFVCRFGGDEFVLALPVKQGFDVESFAIDIMKSLRKPHFTLVTEAKITASIGIMVAKDGLLSFSDLCKKADMAMYKAKQSGKNNYHLYSENLHREYMRNLTIVSSLESALRNDLLDVYFQPKINLQTNEIDSAEALIRWNRGNDDGFGPGEFIPIIESTELIHSIGTWVLNEACRACKAWREEGSTIKMAVNVSALQLTRSGFYQIVVDALEQNGLPPELLEIELTEYSLITEEPLVKKQLAALKKLGVVLAIDDFGTGYSNIAYLTQLQIDVLKLDRGLITQIDQLKERRVVVNAVVKMAKELNMKVVAEGIETEAEREAIASLGCDYGQGYLWSKAVPSSEFIVLIGKGAKGFINSKEPVIA
jgi:diguanylate cyclase (GGDEF)-like protein